MWEVKLSRLNPRGIVLTTVVIFKMYLIKDSVTLKLTSARMYVTSHVKYCSPLMQVSRNYCRSVMTSNIVHPLNCVRLFCKLCYAKKIYICIYLHLQNYIYTIYTCNIYMYKIYTFLIVFWRISRKSEHLIANAAV